MAHMPQQGHMRHLAHLRRHLARLRHLPHRGHLTLGHLARVTHLSYLAHLWCLAWRRHSVYLSHLAHPRVTVVYPPLHSFVVKWCAAIILGNPYRPPIHVDISQHLDGSLCPSRMVVNTNAHATKATDVILKHQ